MTDVYIEHFPYGSLYIQFVPSLFDVFSSSYPLNFRKATPNQVTKLKLRGQPIYKCEREREKKRGATKRNGIQIFIKNNSIIRMFENFTLVLIL